MTKNNILLKNLQIQIQIGFKILHKKYLNQKSQSGQWTLFLKGKIAEEYIQIQQQKTTKIVYCETCGKKHLILKKYNPENYPVFCNKKCSDEYAHSLNYI